MKTVAPAPLIPALAVAQADAGLAASRTCKVLQPVRKPGFCTLGETVNPKLTVALVGDSFAAQWASALANIATRQHWKLIVSTHAGCPWTAAMTIEHLGTKPFTACKEWGVALQKKLLNEIEPDVVIASDRPTVGVESHNEHDAKANTVIGEGMATYWRALAAQGTKIVGIHETPDVRWDIPGCLAGRGGSIAFCSAPARKAVRGHNMPIDVAVRATGASASVIDLDKFICDESLCMPIIGNVLVYKTGQHLTNTYTLTIQPYLEKMLLTVPALARR